MVITTKFLVITDVTNKVELFLVLFMRNNEWLKKKCVTCTANVNINFKNIASVQNQNFFTIILNIICWFAITEIDSIEEQQ